MWVNSWQILPMYRHLPQRLKDGDNTDDGLPTNLPHSNRSRETAESAVWPLSVACDEIYNLLRPRF